MARFHYKASDNNGSKHEGDLECETTTDAITELESRGWIIEALEVAKVPVQGSTDATLTPPLDSNLRHAESQLDSYFDSVVQQRDQLIPILADLIAAIPRGKPRREVQQLSRALTKAGSGCELSSEPTAIRWLPLLLTGLSQGTATQRLGDLLEMTARDSRNRAARRRLLAYPAVVLLVTCLIVVLLSVFIVPSFREIFEGYGIQLPVNTRIVIEFSKLFSEQLPSTLATLGIAAFAFFFLGKLWTRFALTNQLFGRLVAGSACNVSSMASLIGQLADLLTIGVSLPDALRLAGRGCGHHFFQRAAEDLAQQVREPDQSLHTCRAASRLPSNLVHALTAGPEGTPHLPLLHELAVMYSDHATRGTNWTTGAAAHISIVLAGLAVGFVVIALFAPLISLVSGLA